MRDTLYVNLDTVLLHPVTDNLRHLSHCGIEEVEHRLGNVGSDVPLVGGSSHLDGLFCADIPPKSVFLGVSERLVVVFGGGVFRALPLQIGVARAVSLLCLSVLALEGGSLRFLLGLFGELYRILRLRQRLLFLRALLTAARSGALNESHYIIPGGIPPPPPIRAPSWAIMSPPISGASSPVGGAS